MFSAFTRLGALAVGAAVAGLLVAGPVAAAEPVATVPNLDVTATYDKDAYRTGDRYRLQVTIRNTGAEPLTGLVVLVNAPDSGRAGNKPFAPEFAIGGTLAPGETRAAGFSGAIPSRSEFHASVTALQRPANQVTRLTYTVPVTVVKGTVTGRAFTDRNGNGAYDEGEARVGATVLANPRTEAVLTGQAVTDVEGRFSLELPTVPHVIQVMNTSPSDHFQPLYLDVRETGNPDLQFITLVA